MSAFFPGGIGIRLRFFAFAILLYMFPAQIQALEIPRNDGFVTDSAGILDTQQEEELENILSAYLNESGNTIAILILPSLERREPIDVALEALRKWGVGTSAQNNGVVLLVSYSDRAVAIATGYGMEGVLPDLAVKGIIETDILPGFRAGDYFGGIEQGVSALQKHIGGEYTPGRYADPDQAGALGIFGIYLIIIVLDFLAAFLGRSRSWWLGGILGAVVGLALALYKGWWLGIPVLVLAGLIFDYIVSRGQGSSWLRNTRRRWSGTGRRGGGGGYSGFGGGSGGGGGASGRW